MPSSAPYTSSRLASAGRGPYSRPSRKAGVTKRSPRTSRASSAPSTCATSPCWSRRPGPTTSSCRRLLPQGQLPPRRVLALQLHQPQRRRPAHVADHLLGGGVAPGVLHHYAQPVRPGPQLHIVHGEERRARLGGQLPVPDLAAVV